MVERPLSMIVAASRNGVIGRDGDLPWRLSSDLRRFKRLTWGHHLIMGRRTFDSIGKLLPGRTTVILTRQVEWSLPGAIVARSLDEALAAVAGDSEPFVVGGAAIYRELLPWTGKLYLTRVDADVQGDTRLPPISWPDWRLVKSESIPADAANQFTTTLEIYLRH